jgi:hypothetical protein
MLKFRAVVVEDNDSYITYMENFDGFVGTGKDLTELKNSLLNDINHVKEQHDKIHSTSFPVLLMEPFEIEFRMDLAIFWKLFKNIFTLAGLSRMTGIHQKQLWGYFAGKHVPRKEQLDRIHSAIQCLGKELTELNMPSI